MSDRRLAAGLLALALALRLPVFMQVFWSGDEATYAALANAVLGGQALYVGAVDHKPPLTVLTYAGVLGAFGRTALPAVHVLSILVVAATGLLVVVAGRRLGLAPRAAALAGWASVLFASFGPPQDVLAANSEIFMLLPSAGALAVAARAARQGAPTRRWAMAGLLAGLAGLYKYQGAAVLVPVLALAVRSGPARAAVRRSAAVAAGALVLPLAIATWYGWSGHLADLAFWAWTYPLRYAGTLGAAQALSRAARGTLGWAVPCAVLVLGAVAGLASHRADGGERSRLSVLLLWLVASAAAVAAGGRFFLHYYLQLVPPLALVAAPALAGLASASHALRRAAVLAVVVPAAGSWGAAVLDAHVRPEVAAQTAVYREVGAFIDAHGGARDTLLVWGNSPEIYHFARRHMGTRFPFCNHLAGKIWGTPADLPGAPVPPSQVVAEAWPMLLDDLGRRRPEWIVDAAAGRLDRWEGRGLDRYPALAAVVEREYERVATVAGVPVYRRCGGGPAPGPRLEGERRLCPRPSPAENGPRA